MKNPKKLPSAGRFHIQHGNSVSVKSPPPPLTSGGKELGGSRVEPVTIRSCELVDVLDQG